MAERTFCVTFGGVMMLTAVSDGFGISANPFTASNDFDSPSTVRAAACGLIGVAGREWWMYQLKTARGRQ
jgi:hypothetical protein